ncbi:cytosolic sulfotransferase 3-like [Brachionichthys hirsutus]|uniref:cytosolic sulfotransferase 3-like n=1 Tax=Brachionichthys hirsutus TaxID=412623 RepID=UPI003604F697
MEELTQRPTMFNFHGVPMIEQFTSNWDNVQDFKARADDILISSYMKSGNTWVSYLLELLYFGKTDPERLASLPLHCRVPFLEMSQHGRPNGKDLADQLPTTPRLIKTHLPVQFIPKSFWEHNVKIIYVARNAKDDAVSSFHFSRMNASYPDLGDWDNFLRNFMDGNMVYGSWYDHVNSWWEKKQTYLNLHYMFYEDMIEDSGRETDRLCSFLGLSPSVADKERILAEVKFDKMKVNKTVNFSTLKYMNQNISPFMRKGTVGDWKNHFTVAQNEKFDEDYKQKMKNSVLQFRTEV